MDRAEKEITEKDSWTRTTVCDCRGEGDIKGIKKYQFDNLQGADNGHNSNHY